MARTSFGPAKAANGAGDGALHAAFMDMMPAPTARARTARQLAGSKHELPGKTVIGAGKLDGESVGHVHSAETAGQIAPVQRPAPFQLPGQCVAGRMGQHQKRSLSPFPPRTVS